ncbi:hypothetical protein OQA88_7656 [Cercophora sp. LCS_1]
MASLENCFVNRVTEPVQWIEVPSASAQPQSQGQQGQAQLRQLQFSNLPELAQHIQNDASGFSCRFISVCQRNSWQPLQITKAMMDLVVSSHDIDPSFWDVPSCFYSRSIAVEEVLCIPFTETRRENVIEISYTIKYPEYKPDEDEWVIRQSGVWHRYNGKTGQSTYVLFSPTPKSKAHQMALEWLKSGQRPESEPFWLHRVLFSVYFPGWRTYIGDQERQFLPIANTTFATFIDEPLRLGYNNLSALVGLKTRFLQVPTMLQAASETLSELCSLLGMMSEVAATHPGTLELKNHLRRSKGYSQTATYLRQRTQTTARLLSDTLSFRDQVVAKEQNGNMLQLNKSAVFITTLTLLYLPASFVASFFGMNFFDFDEEGGTMVGTGMVWIYVVSSVILTAVTFLFYYWLLHRDGAVFRRLAPKVRASQDWKKTLARRLTSNPKEAAIKLESSEV